MNEDALNLTGHWHGIFNYPRHFPPTEFEAALHEQGGAIDGTTREADRLSGADRSATLIGSRTGHHVRFTKFYDEMVRPGGDRLDTVLYEGTLSPEGDEINGTWRIPGSWSGSFILIRPIREEARESCEIEAPVELP